VSAGLNGILVPMDQCTERDKLKTEAAHALKDIIDFTDRLLKAVSSEQPCGSLTPLDKDLENAVGTKERAFGALAQHCKEHGCDEVTERKLTDAIAK
jgi:hypothetical protein